MAKTKTKDVSEFDVVEEIKKDFEIKSASIKDHQCSYGYEILTGPTRGDLIPGRKGVHLIHDDLNDSFSELSIFLMHIDDYFKNDEDINNQTPLSKLEEHEDLNRYWVSGFKVTGFDENKSLILIGQKQVTNGLIAIVSPKIKLDGTYLYVEELNERLRIAINEVEAYMNGKSAPKLEQLSLIESFEEEDNIDIPGEFENAEV